MLMGFSPSPFAKFPGFPEIMVGTSRNQEWIHLETQNPMQASGYGWGKRLGGNKQNIQIPKIRISGKPGDFGTVTRIVQLYLSYTFTSRYINCEQYYYSTTAVILLLLQ